MVYCGGWVLGAAAGRHNFFPGLSYSLDIQLLLNLLLNFPKEDISSQKVRVAGVIPHNGSSFYHIILIIYPIIFINKVGMGGNKDVDSGKDEDDDEEDEDEKDEE